MGPSVDGCSNAVFSLLFCYDLCRDVAECTFPATTATTAAAAAAAATAAVGQFTDLCQHFFEFGELDRFGVVGQGSHVSLGLLGEEQFGVLTVGKVEIHVQREPRALVMGGCRTRNGGSFGNNTTISETDPNVVGGACFVARPQSGV